MTTEFTEGMRVRPVARLVAGVPDDESCPQPGEVGTVIIIDTYNGDIHVDFPRAGVGVYNPDELEVIDDSASNTH